MQGRRCARDLHRPGQPAPPTRCAPANRHWAATSARSGSAEHVQQGERQQRRLRRQGRQVSHLEARFIGRHGALRASKSSGSAAYPSRSSRAIATWRVATSGPGRLAYRRLVPRRRHRAPWPSIDQGRERVAQGGVVLADEQPQCVQAHHQPGLSDWRGLGLRLPRRGPLHQVCLIGAGSNTKAYLYIVCNV